MIASNVLLKTFIAETAPENLSNAESDDITRDDELFNLCEKACAP